MENSMCYMRWYSVRDNEFYLKKQDIIVFALCVHAPATLLKPSFTFVATSPTGKMIWDLAKTATMAAATALTDLPTDDSEIPRLSTIRRRWAPVATKRRNTVRPAEVEPSWCL